MRNGDKPVSPTWEYDENGQNPKCDGGLTKREYFAAMAMQGIMTTLPDPGCPPSDGIAEMAVKQADALLEELSKPKTTEK